MSIVQKQFKIISIFFIVDHWISRVSSASIRIGIVEYHMGCLSEEVDTALVADLPIIEFSSPSVHLILGDHFGILHYGSHVIGIVRSISYVSETIVVDDGSTDGTAKIAERAGAKVIKHSTNKGKGAAIKTGFKKSKGDVAVFLDADLHTLTVEQVEKIIKPILNGEADITKTKFKREAGRVTELTAKPLLKFFFPELKFDQPLSGQFAAKRSFLNSINLEDDYGVDVGIVLDADVRGMRVKEVDIGKIEHVQPCSREILFQQDLKVPCVLGMKQNLHLYPSHPVS